ncbi:MAG: C25 family cysteine peptidase [Candidatus Eisenbacteria bacterium]
MCRPTKQRAFFREPRFPILAGCLLLFLFLASGSVAAGPYADVRVLSEDETGVLFDFTLSDLRTDPVSGGRVILRLSGCSLPEEAGIPAVPSLPLLVALPPHATAEAEILESTVEETAAYPVAPMPELRNGDLAFGDWDPDLPAGFWPSEWIEVGTPARLRDQRACGIAVHPIRFDRETGTTRVLRRARIRVTFVGGALKSGENVAEVPEEGLFQETCRRVFLNSGSCRSWKTAPRGARKVLRGDSFGSSADWVRMEIGERGLCRVTHDDLVGLGVLDPRSALGDARGIRVYAGSGQPVPPDLSSPRPEWMEQVAIRVIGEEDGSFDIEDAVEFYALPAAGWLGEFEPGASRYHEHVEHPHVVQNVYWLTWGGDFEEEPFRMGFLEAGPSAAGPGPSTLRTFTDRVHAEENLLMDLSRYGEDGWFWARFTPTDNEQSFFVRTFDADTTKESEVRVRFFHYADALGNCGTERVRIQVNGFSSSLQEWNSCELENNTIRPFDYDSTARWVADGLNRFDIQVSFRKKIYLCWIEMGYERYFRAREGKLWFRLAETGGFRIPLAGFSPESIRVLDVTDCHRVEELTGFASSGDSVVVHLAVETPRALFAVDAGRILSPKEMRKMAPVDLRRTGGGASFLALAADELAGVVQPLLDRRSSDLSTRIVRLSDVYSNFSWGLPDPVAIRDFLAFAFHNWPEADRPAYVLLVGDASKDFRNRQAGENRNLLPSFLRVDPEGSKTNTYSTDDFFTYLDPDSGGGDWAPDLAIGRLPAQDANEAAAMVAKIGGYAVPSTRGPWQGRVLFLADDHFAGSPYRQDCGFSLSFTRDAEGLADLAAGSFEKNRVYLVEYPFEGRHGKPRATEEYHRRMREGFLFSAYVGHGGFDKLAQEDLLTTHDVVGGRLKPGDPLHFFAAFSCDAGGFDLPSRDCLAEALLKLPGAGAVGCLAASAPTFGGANFNLAEEFIGALLSDPRGSPPVGLALLAAKALAGSGPYRNINNEKYALLGDPALRLAVPGLAVRLPGLDTLALQRGAAATLRGEVLDESGEVASGFDGIVALTIRADADTTGFLLVDTVCYGSPGRPRFDHASYSLPGTAFFQGEADVSAGRFSAEFFAPLDADPGSGARAGAYALSSGGIRDAFGGSDSLLLLAEPDDFEAGDTEGPVLTIRVDGVRLRDGGWVRKDTRFEVTVEDPSGIYQGGEEARRVGCVADGSVLIDLSPWFAFERNRCREGSLRFRPIDLPGLKMTDGAHELVFRASDNLGNVSQPAYRIVFVPEIPRLFFRHDVMNYPNPFDPDREETEFFVDLSRDADVVIQIFTLTGKKIRSFEGCRASGPTRLGDCVWDGRDEDGDRVANGVYLIRAVAATPSGEERVESIGKAVVQRVR